MGSKVQECQVGARRVLHEAKAVVVASSDTLASRLRLNLGKLGGVKAGQTRRLGVDFAPGRMRRRLHGGTVLRKRLKEVRGRVQGDLSGKKIFVTDGQMYVSVEIVI